MSDDIFDELTKPDDLGEKIGYACRIFEFPETQFYICARSDKRII